MAKDSALPFLLLGGAVAALTIVSREPILTVVHSSIPGTPSEWLRKLYPSAVVSAKTTGVPALFTLSQAAIESGFGKHGPGNNFFGIKAGSTWPGAIQKLLTWECGATGDPSKDHIKDDIVAIYPPGDKAGICSKGYSYRVRGKFRAYNSPADGFADHGSFLRSNVRYKPAFAFTDPKKFATAVSKAGYATAPNYESALHKMIDLVQKAVS